MDPFLGFLNKILMEEGTEDATCMQHIDRAAYQAIFSAFHKILGADSYTIGYEDVSDPRPLLHDQRIIRANGPDDEQQLKVVNLSDGLYSSRSSEPGISLPAVDHPQSCAQQEGDETGGIIKHDSGFQDHELPTKSSQITEHHAMQNGMFTLGSHLISSAEAGGGPWPSSYEALIQNYHNAFKLNADILDAMDVSCYAAVDALCVLHRCNMAGQEQANVIYKLPSVDDEFSSKFAEVDLSFENLNLNDIYADLYVPKRSTSGNSAGDCKQSGDKKTSLGRKLGKRKKTLEGQVLLVDVMEVLARCARAVAKGDLRMANMALQEIRQVHGASANGTSVQRLAHFFSKALVVRMRGMGEHLFKAMSHKIPSVWTVLQPSNSAYNIIPFSKITHYFANQSILKAAEGASRLHIVDYGLMYGTQWPCLINALAERQGGPPLLVITGIQSSQPGIDPAERLEKSLVRLAAYAKAFNVPFQYHAIISNKCENLDAASLNLHAGEVLVVNCIAPLSHLIERSASGSELTTCPLQKLLTFMHGLNPHLLVTSVRSYLAHNSPSFVSRFPEALYSYSNMFDMLDTLLGDTPQRHLMERSAFYSDILNIVGCEHVVRLETYKKWHACFAEAGFEQMPIPPAVLSMSRSYVQQHHHKDFFIHDDATGGWMLIGWKGRTFFAFSAWKPGACVEGSG